ncbi:hypothetical protein ACTXT7_001904 [Hymenolepis weldensis]
MTEEIRLIDVSEQNDELQALESIYPDEFTIVDHDQRCYKISVTSEGSKKHTVELKFTFIPGYPSENPPLYEISAPTLQKIQRSNLLQILNEVCMISLGSAMIFSMVETIKSFLGEQDDENNRDFDIVLELDDLTIDEPTDNVVRSVYAVPSIRDHLAACGRRLPIAEGVPCPKIYHGETITDRKSVFQSGLQMRIEFFNITRDSFCYVGSTRFVYNLDMILAVWISFSTSAGFKSGSIQQLPLPSTLLLAIKGMTEYNLRNQKAHCCEVSSLSEVSAFISTVLEDRKVAAATHNITAWYLRTKLKVDAPTTSLVADYDDDGETQAGGRLLHLISLAAKEGVVVTRWYGGIHLGPDRFKHINNAASQLLTYAGLTKNSNPENIQPKSKGSGKKKA